MSMRFFCEGLVKHLIPSDGSLYKKLKLLSMKNLAKKASLPNPLLSFQVKLVEHCNLNCKSCFVFSPIAKAKFLSVDTFIRDCKQLSKLTNRRVGNIAQILEFLSKSVPFCRYCNIKGIVTGIKWGISKKEISEWT